ncbi:hypothetical protein Slin14017_G043350 [Septoria linicola]|nr:hypothetical protein Slin14017_G043350 [Septoria linicola]
MAQSSRTPVSIPSAQTIESATGPKDAWDMVSKPFHNSPALPPENSTDLTRELIRVLSKEIKTVERQAAVGFGPTMDWRRSSKVPFVKTARESFATGRGGLCPWE